MQMRSVIVTLLLLLILAVILALMKVSILGRHWQYCRHTGVILLYSLYQGSLHSWCEVALFDRGKDVIIRPTETPRTQWTYAPCLMASDVSYKYIAILLLSL